jgi:hypothetical protein
VLDPAMIARRGAKLGKNPKVITIYGGLHDLILSDKKVREAAYDSLFNFINTH